MAPMDTPKVAIIGAGVMGEAMIHALQRIGLNSSDITIREKRLERQKELVNKYGVSSGSIESSQFILLAVKPQDLANTLDEISPEMRHGALVVSLLAGVKSSRIEELVGLKARVVRVMPNTPILIGEGMSVISKGTSATEEDVEWTKSLLAQSGSTLVIDEGLMDVVTATSGSGPAYFFAFAEAIENSAKRLGLSETQAKVLARETFIGAALILDKSGQELSTLRQNVTSPNGTTSAALQKFKDLGLEEMIYEAMKAAQKRSSELST